MFLHDNHLNVSEAQRFLNKAAFSLDGCQQIRQVTESMPRQPSHPITVTGECSVRSMPEYRSCRATESPSRFVVGRSICVVIICFGFFTCENESGSCYSFPQYCRRGCVLNEYTVLRDKTPLLRPSKTWKTSRRRDRKILNVIRMS